jgi:parvulin-like peptidyl-prolyl isomerase
MPDLGLRPSLMGNAEIDAKHFVAAAKFLELFEPVHDHVTRRTAVVRAARKEGTGVQPPELQAEADAYRRVLGLHRAQAMTAWLGTIGYSLDDFEEEMEYRILRRKKRASFTAKEVEACFKEQRADLDRARISQIVVPAESLARELVEQVNAERKDFAKLAAQHSLDDATRETGGHLGWVRRRDLLPELAPRVFSGTAGRCVAPFKLPDGTVQVVLVHETRPATLDATTEEELRDLLVARWLNELTGAGRRP